MRSKTKPVALLSEEQIQAFERLVASLDGDVDQVAKDLVSGFLCDQEMIDGVVRLWRMRRMRRMQHT